MSARSTKVGGAGSISPDRTGSHCRGVGCVGSNRRSFRVGGVSHRSSYGAGTGCWCSVVGGAVGWGDCKTPRHEGDCPAPGWPD